MQKFEASCFRFQDEEEGDKGKDGKKAKACLCSSVSWALYELSVADGTHSLGPCQDAKGKNDKDKGKGAKGGKKGGIDCAKVPFTYDILPQST